MLPFPSPNESINLGLEAAEQSELEDDAMDIQDRPDDLSESKDGAETKKASEETLDDQG